MSVKDEKEKELEHLSQETEIFELDQVISEGVNAKIPFTFTYPNTNKKVGVLVRPLSTNEYQRAILSSKKLKTNFLIELAKLGVYRMDESRFPEELIMDLPAGVITMITNEINRISGVELVDGSEEVQQQIFDDLMGF
ncbi:MAG: hypothetical protein IJH12_02080 [Clostridia bacterium]|nr:hypothetical protein [Clostridia bacterium]